MLLVHLFLVSFEIKASRIALTSAAASCNLPSAMLVDLRIVLANRGSDLSSALGTACTPTSDTS
ncbi:hypothetical protein PF005_g31494 [Phytophthora fragariae]|uniref:Secreted protein n=1 Tax=Phytophthora fragariae TaxID=53985 RepID=A0A6A3DBL1_9STRA|nr:hypothetical protein PF003_g31236 [Phytophthora fragariae]KAE8919084.1 hypothetical protein PF009_g30602 [Phytophthora fragariae]KAE9157201.1 hypothetical protein PF002_g33426 [Phytophthora fragariae]KAE9160806.1 hypothetical protein PF005_g31494 [Phytophthora fragariae]KAE9266120.1 hypothetical protein PF008_g31686 [Phytophthora fragariae]